MGQAGCKRLSQALFDYKTEKYVIAKNKKVGLLYRLLQVSILTYLVATTALEVMRYSRGFFPPIYEAFPEQLPPPGLEPPVQGLWKGGKDSESIPNAVCYEDSDCPLGEPVMTGNGVRTGRCLQSGNMQRGTCEIFAWCPVETKSRPEKPLLGKAEDFTIYIKNFIRFPKFNFSKTNVPDTKDRDFLKSCRFDPKNPYCPIFRLGSVVSWTGSNFQEIALQGGVIGIQIEWDCDLDKAPSECNPRYHFSRLDSRIPGNSVSSGYNFSWAQRGSQERNKWLEGSFFCDLVLIYFIKKSHFYRNKKYEEARSVTLLSQRPEGSGHAGNGKVNVEQLRDLQTVEA
ncbi:PREDICTED: P2X purinoceptor 5 [Hipposideros armiger]|uniref:P2X purinoceptor 5 n=1 Tax=Hipposideros armiger TaxID=186990 RepID=A0A8B7SPN3_HIPAR|nr:PREDICTED: P2X purinoceptor 5 [Hipposideros armiger]